MQRLGLAISVPATRCACTPPRPAHRKMEYSQLRQEDRADAGTLEREAAFSSCTAVDTILIMKFSFPGFRV